MYSEKTKQSPIIHLDRNKNLKGLEHLDTLYQIIQKKLCATITYQSFKARDPSTFTFHPFILKEFNNRWFLIGTKSKQNSIFNLALDRIIKIDFDLKTTLRNNNFDGEEYFKNTIGVTVLNENHLKNIYLKINEENAPYVITKPFHASQKTTEVHEDRSITIHLRVHFNFEFERLILGFGSAIEVLQPRDLKKRIIKNLKIALENYDEKETKTLL